MTISGSPSHRIVKVADGETVGVGATFRSDALDVTAWRKAGVTIVCDKDHDDRLLGQVDGPVLANGSFLYSENGDSLNRSGVSGSTSTGRTYLVDVSALNQLQVQVTNNDGADDATVDVWVGMGY
jgi:hypothetical protein